MLREMIPKLWKDSILNPMQILCVMGDSPGRYRKPDLSVRLAGFSRILENMYILRCKQELLNTMNQSPGKHNFWYFSNHYFLARRWSSLWYLQIRCDNLGWL